MHFSAPRTLICLLALLPAFSCSDRPGSEADPGPVQGGLAPDPKDTAVFGDAPAKSSPEMARGIATQVVTATVSQCGGGCSADLATGHARLRAGEMLEAFEAFKCADTPEAAFGAGLSKLLGALEGGAADRLLADIGQPHFPARDLFGPEGYLARVAERYNGSAEIALAGAFAASFASERVEADDWQLEVHHNDGARRLRLSVETDAAWPDGTVLPARYDCASGGRALSTLPRVYVDLEQGSDHVECDVPFALPTGCTADGGSVRVVTSGSAPGDRIELEFANLMLRCESYTDQDADDDVGPTERGTVTLNGRAFATVTGDIDVSGLHPAFSREKDETLIDRVDPKLGFAEFANHAAAIAGELAGARCYFDKAAKGSGQVFVLPGTLYAGQDLSIAAADARMFASAASLGAAFVELATAYELDQPLRALVCYTHNDLGEHPACPSEAEFVSALNAAARTAHVRPDRIEAAHRLLALGLEDFDLGVRALSERSALVRNAVSAPGWDMLQEVATAARRSLDSGSTLVPRIAPAVRVDLAAFFATPPDPGGIAVPLLRRSELCDGTECDSDIEVDPAFVEAFFDDTDADFEAEYSLEGRDALEDAAREVLLKLEAAGLFLGG